MTEETITKWFDASGLGPVLSPVRSVSGGLMHRMYRVDTPQGSYAVKHLSPEIMKRPGAMANYRRAEELEKILEEAKIPIVPALAFGGRKMQETDGAYFYLFRWHNGRITDWHHITRGQCRQAGNIQGRIHALRPGQAAQTKISPFTAEWGRYAEEAARQRSVIAPLLKDHVVFLNDVQEKLNSARQALPDVECITDEDMDPKNVIWEDGRPLVIDLECLDWGNPVSSALQLSLQWSGITTCSLDPDLLRAFFDGYLEAYDNGFRDYGSVLGLAYTWIEWLEYNITRALGRCQDEKERETGIKEVYSTMDRLEYIRQQEDTIRQSLLFLMP